ncbi:phenylalanine-tRNA ligase, alpha subunit [Edhazardia aedis USNM 41457]|uniref:phenylalanine--tRNA ligase n=1 Tax=Edhazardia aedis (strain USNM 41457) TaxID=1003232 RepID=J8ZYS9_EDHAE|nr:phenylalanine-tRNA ligase, alpha subunit [Edhazardia aedis USNM 41457]|eukprot:EJW04833.1 phenylalanine-tRNA ligase, alpha subunit [Edhazardia aedis USNM 41457]
MSDELVEKLLSKLSIQPQISSEELNEPLTDVVSVLKKLSAHEMITFDTIDSTIYELSEIGKETLEKGSPEGILFALIKDDDTSLEELKAHKIGLSFAFKYGWIGKRENIIFKKKNGVKDVIREMVSDFVMNKTENVDISVLKQRKMIESRKVKSYIIRKGANYADKLIKQETSLTSDMIVNKTYETCKFKKYNFDTVGNLPEKGNLHPLMKVREEFRSIFLTLGFTEMRTNKYIESSFWNFDALFQPQNHPSRDSHDTFFIENDLPIDADNRYINKVKNIHEKGGHGSLGYLNTWNIEEARKGILRTHTTSCSARHLYNICNFLVNGKCDNNFSEEMLEKLKKNKVYKLFSIDKVFRNETVDATHLAEFHQIEGVIIGENLTLGQLMGVIDEFYQRLGLRQIKFKPAFNPYTEPSMEIFGYHDGMKKWIEIGNSGIFRPEMLKPMGFDDKITVFGWGLSLERPTMIKYNIKNIRDLVGHKVKLNFIKEGEVCYF